MVKTSNEPAAKPVKSTKAPAPAKPKPVSPLTLGNTVLIRTVTHYHVGTIVLLDASEIVLSGASWVADTGRFGQMLKTGTLSEVEPFVDLVSVSRNAYVDATLWPHPLPTEAK
jgi:hypothetical protein